jgi:hypothetical protein
VNAARRFALRSRFVGALAAASLMVGVVSGARAQDQEPVEPHKWDVRLGAFFPTQGVLRGQAGSPYLVVAGDYNPNFRYKPAGGNVFFSVDFKFRDSGNLSFLTIPLTANIAWNLLPATDKYRLWGGLGGGVYFINTGFIGGTTQAGARFFVGADITDRYFLMLDYDWVGGFTDYRGNGVRVDGLTFSAGYRF